MRVHCETLRLLQQCYQPPASDASGTIAMTNTEQPEAHEPRHAEQRFRAKRLRKTPLAPLVLPVYKPAADVMPTRHTHDEAERTSQDDTA